MNFNNGYVNNNNKTNTRYVRPVFAYPICAFQKRRRPSPPIEKMRE